MTLTDRRRASPAFQCLRREAPPALKAGAGRPLASARPSCAIRPGRSLRRGEAVTDEQDAQRRSRAGAWRVWTSWPVGLLGRSLAIKVAIAASIHREHILTDARAQTPGPLAPRRPPAILTGAALALPVPVTPAAHNRPKQRDARGLRTGQSLGGEVAPFEHLVLHGQVAVMSVRFNPVASTSRLSKPP